MATVINNPGTTSDGSGNNGMGFLAGIIILIIVLVLFFYYGLPYLRGSVGTPQVNVPSTINVHTSK